MMCNSKTDTCVIPVCITIVETIFLFIRTFMKQILYVLILGGLIPWFSMGITPTPNMKHYHVTVTWLWLFKITITFSAKSRFDPVNYTKF